MLVAALSDDTDMDENMPAVVGAGKSGPGGAGKTNMLGSWCLPDRSRAAVSGRKVLVAPCKPCEADADAVLVLVVGRNGDKDAAEVDGRKPSVGVE